MSAPEETETNDRGAKRADARASAGLRARIEVVLFAVALLLPSIGYWLGWNDFALLAENRRLAERPGWPADVEALRAFPMTFERHFDDHFGFRSFLVGRDKRLAWLGRRTEVEIQVGRDGWLFQGDRQGVVEMTCTRPEDDVLASWLDLGLERQKRFESEGIAFFWAMAPNKHSLYPERLPDFARSSVESCPARDLAARLREAGVPFLDLRERLLAVRKERPLYHATDTHWNQLGAAHGVDALIESVRERFPAVPAFDWSDYDVVTEPEPFEGNLAARLRVYGEHYEEPFVRLVRRTPARARRSSTDAPIDLRVHSREDPVVEFATGREALPTAWVFHDSFGFATMELLAEHFESVRFFNSRGWIDAASFEGPRPDLVIALFVEAHLLEAARTEPDWRRDRALAQQR